MDDVISLWNINQLLSSPEYRSFTASLLQGREDTARSEIRSYYLWFQHLGPEWIQDTEWHDSGRASVSLMKLEKDF